MKQNSIKKYMLTIILMFIGLFMINTDVYAGTCSKYDTKCIVCKTKVGQDDCYFDVTYTVVADGRGSADIVDVSHERKYTGSPQLCRSQFENTLSGNNFINKNKNNLVCPNVFLNTTAGANYSTVYKLQMDKTNTAVNFTKVDENNNKFKDSNVNSITCVFSGKDTTSGNKVADIKITTDGKTVKGTATNGYQISDLSGIDASLFINSSGKLYCPGNVFYAGCGSSGSNKFCSLHVGESIRGETTPSEEEIPGGTILPEDEKNDEEKTEEKVPVNCRMLSEIIPYIEKVFMWIQILVPIALIVFGFLDFTGPIISSDKDALNKATSKFIKRCIIAVVIFFVPIIVNLLLDIYNDATGANTTICGLGKIIINYWR